MPSSRPTLYGSRHAVSAGHYLAAACRYPGSANIPSGGGGQFWWFGGPPEEGALTPPPEDEPPLRPDAAEPLPVPPLWPLAAPPRLLAAPPGKVQRVHEYKIRLKDHDLERVLESPGPNAVERLAPGPLVEVACK